METLRPLLVLLHFLGGSARSWSAMASALPAEVDVLAIDLPGFGDASSAAGYDVSAMADHVAARVGGVGHAGPIVLVGHSMGAKVALALARRAEDGDRALAGLRGLVLIAGSPPAPEPMKEEKRQQMLSQLDGADDARRHGAERYILDNVAERLPDRLHDQAVEDVLRAEPAAWQAWLSAGSLEDWTDHVGLIHVPVLALAGDGDEALGAEAQRDTIERHFTNARLIVLERRSHLLPLESPAEVAALIAEHISSIAAAAAAVPPDYEEFIRSSRVGAGTRAVLLGRDAGAAGPAALDLASRHTLRALTDRLVPQDGPAPIDIVQAIDSDLVDGRGDGWRFAQLPADRDAMQAGLATLDVAATPSSFAALSPDAQDDLIGRAMAGGLAPSGAALDAKAMRLWMQDCHAAAVRAYMSHPRTLARVGYSGIANGGDSPRLETRTVLSEGEVAAWEPRPELAA